MLSLLSSVATFIPVVGPIVDGIVTIFKNRSDAKVATAKIDSDERVQTMQASNSLVSLFVNDVMVRVCRDIIMFPGSIYCGTIIWDRWVEIRHPELVWGVKPLMGSMELLPFALLTFFFGSAYLYWTQRK
jgi:hypothetical protein